MQKKFNVETFKTSSTYKEIKDGTTYYRGWAYAPPHMNQNTISK